LAVYQAGLDAGDASFETEAPAWTAFDSAKLPGHRHVATADDTGELLGWVAAGPVSGRSAYAGVVEHSVYVAPEARGRGVGGALDPGADRLHRGRRDLDHPVLHLPGEHRQPPPARAEGLPRGGHPRADRPPARPVARRGPGRAAQHRRWRALTRPGVALAGTPPPPRPPRPR